MRVIHLGTDVKCVFAVVDDNDNIVTTLPLSSIQVADFNKESYEKVVAKFLEAKAKFKAQYEAVSAQQKIVAQEKLETKKNKS